MMTYEIRATEEEIQAIINFYFEEQEKIKKRKDALSSDITREDVLLSYCNVGRLDEEYRNNLSRISQLKELVREGKIKNLSWELLQEKEELKGFFISQAKIERLMQIEIELDKIRENCK